MPSPTKLISSYIRSKVSALQSGYVARAPYALGQLAALRQAGLTDVGDDPRVWTLVFDGFPADLEARGLAPSRAERAVQSALVLFAHHQQSQTEPMHRHGAPFGAAVGMLARARARDAELDESTLRRFQAAAMAQTHASRVRLLRQLVSMMRTEKSPTIGLDYGILASDLYTFQFPERAHQVRLAWGRHLHRTPSTTVADSTHQEN